MSEMNANSGKTGGGGRANLRWRVACAPPCLLRICFLFSLRPSLSLFVCVLPSRLPLRLLLACLCYALPPCLCVLALFGFCVFFPPSDPIRFRTFAVLEASDGQSPGPRRAATPPLRAGALACTPPVAAACRCGGDIRSHDHTLGASGLRRRPVQGRPWRQRLPRAGVLLLRPTSRR